MHFKHTNRPGFWFGFVDFCTAGLFFLFYMPLSGLQDELDYIVGRRTQRYWVAYLLGIPTLFLYTGKGYRAGHRGAPYLLVAHVRLEHHRRPVSWSANRHEAVLRHAQQD